MSESEEMYLVTLAMLEETGVRVPIPVSRLANELNIQPVSVNQMVRKLEETGLVIYTPYKGVVLTPEGEVRALRVLRHRRLWEVFLVNQLHLLPELVADLACKLEHVLPDDVADRLSQFLGHPLQNPQGKTIPSPQAHTLLLAERNLIQMKTGERSQVSRIQADDASYSFLTNQGICAGSPVTMLAVGSDGAILAEFGGRTVHLSKRTAQTILILP